MRVNARTVIIAISFVLGLTWQQSLMAGPEDEQAALASSGAWLTLVDSGEYDRSWDQAATLFKESVTKEQWMKALETIRTPLGKLVARTMASVKYSTSMPGVPDGQYVVSQYNTSFENKKSAVETVTSMLDKDGKWRVAGYLIQ